MNSAIQLSPHENTLCYTVYRTLLTYNMFKRLTAIKDRNYAYNLYNKINILHMMLNDPEVKESIGSKLTPEIFDNLKSLFISYIKDGFRPYGFDLIKATVVVDLFTESGELGHIIEAYAFYKHIRLSDIPENLVHLILDKFIQMSNVLIEDDIARFSDNFCHVWNTAVSIMMDEEVDLKLLNQRLIILFENVEIDIYMQNMTLSISYMNVYDYKDVVDQMIEMMPDEDFSPNINIRTPLYGSHTSYMMYIENTQIIGKRVFDDSLLSPVTTYSYDLCISADNIIKFLTSLCNKLLEPHTAFIIKREAIMLFYIKNAIDHIRRLRWLESVDSLGDVFLTELLMDRYKSFCVSYPGDAHTIMLNWLEKNPDANNIVELLDAINEISIPFEQKITFESYELNTLAMLAAVHNSPYFKQFIPADFKFEKGTPNIPQPQLIRLIPNIITEKDNQILGGCTFLKHDDIFAQYSAEWDLWKKIEDY